VLDGRRIGVREILAQWIEEDATTKHRSRCFRVRGSDRRTHLLRCPEADGVWLHGGGADNG
jgi:hypothetical protein